MSSSLTTVKQTIPLTADGLAQKFVGTSATNITHNTHCECEC